MKSYVYLALVVFLATVAVQGYGPKIHRNHHRGSHRSPQRTTNKPSQGFHHGSSHWQHHWPSRDHFRPPHQHGHWDNSPVWDYRSDPWDSREGSGSGSYDSYGPDYDSDSGSPERFRPSYEDYGDWYDHFHSKHPSKRPHKKPQKTTSTPIPTIHSFPPWTQSSLPYTADTQPTPTPTGIPADVRPDPTTPHFIPRPTRTAGPTPSPTGTTEPKPIGTTWQPTTPTEDTTNWETTTSIPETTTIEGEEEFTTISPEVQNCIDTCIATPEFNPVCGTNGETYSNEGRLFCASSCGVNVSLRRRSVCPPPIFFGDYDEEPPPSTPPTTTSSSIIPRTPPFTAFQRCMKLCRITASFIPVCGTDLVTYMNMDRLKCAQGCGEAVEVLCEKPCAACGSKPVTPKTTTLPPTTLPLTTLPPATLPPTTIANIGRSTQEPEIQECVNACPVTSEYNPLCGSDHVTYSNPSHIICAQLCGVGVIVVHLSECSPTTTTSTTTEDPSATLSPNVLSCIRRCPVTTEYDPVCGSNDLTYANLGNLECSKFCGIEVELKHRSRCFDEFDLGPDEINNIPSNTTQGVNGNKDDVTTPSRRTETTTSLFTSPTTTPTTTLGSPLTTAVAPISASTLGFTIPPDILNDIFGSTSAYARSTTEPTISDKDEDIDLDSRFSIDTDTDKNTGSDSRIIFPD